MLWAVQEGLGLPYIRKSGDLEAVYWDSKEKLVYTGNSERQSKEYYYYYANVVLGFEVPDEDYKKKYSLPEEPEGYKEHIIMMRKVAQARQKYL